MQCCCTFTFKYMYAKTILFLTDLSKVYCSTRKKFYHLLLECASALAILAYNMVPVLHTTWNYCMVSLSTIITCAIVGSTGLCMYVVFAVACGIDVCMSHYTVVHAILFIYTSFSKSASMSEVYCIPTQYWVPAWRADDTYTYVHYQ